MTPEEEGAEIYTKWRSSGFADRETAAVWLESAKKRIAQELEFGFYMAEMKDMHKRKHEVGKKI